MDCQAAEPVYTCRVCFEASPESQLISPCKCAGETAKRRQDRLRGEGAPEGFETACGTSAMSLLAGHPATCTGGRPRHLERHDPCLRARRDAALDTPQVPAPVAGERAEA